ncbi:MAG: hypothetical protein Salg2KO_17860 [Salibacteraceae bacterium]
MFIALKYKETNIVEYILYMWHIEELIRSFNFDMEEIKANVLVKFNLNEAAESEMERWYLGLIQKMTEEGVRDTGHLSELNELMTEIQYLHHSLLTVYQDKDYQELMAKASSSIEELKSKSDGRKRTDIEVAMNGLFGVLVLKLKKRQVSQETQDAIKSISTLMATLARHYKSMKEGTLSFPKVMEN